MAMENDPSWMIYLFDDYDNPQFIDFE
jgi:hypothetical protein